MAHGRLSTAGGPLFFDPRSEDGEGALRVSAPDGVPPPEAPGRNRPLPSPRFSVASCLIRDDDVHVPRVKRRMLSKTGQDEDPCLDPCQPRPALARAYLDTGKMVSHCDAGTFLSTKMMTTWRSATWRDGLVCAEQLFLTRLFLQRSWMVALGHWPVIWPS